MTLVIEKIPNTPYSAIRGVPLVSTGIEYALATGPKTFTEEELQDAVLAIEDPAIVGPRLKIGHKDPRFNKPDHDGEPALGRVENMTVGNNGQTVYGDFVTFDWLANLIPIAYPGRSIEAGLGVNIDLVENHKTVTGRKYRMVLTAVSLLGVVWPGCTTLDDLPLLLDAEGPPGLEVVTARGGGATDGLEAAMNIEDVRTSYYEMLDAEENADQKWWWIRGMRMGDLSEGQLIVDDDDGHLFRVNFAVSGDDVTFSEPAQVVVDYKEVPVAMAAGIAASALVGEGEDAIIYATRAESRPDTINPGGDMTRAELCASLGLPVEATDEQIQAATSRVMASSTESEESDEGTNGDIDPSGGEADQESSEESDAESEGEEVTAGSRPRAVTVDAAAFESLQRDAALARRHEEERVAAANEQIVDTAIRDGRFPPSARASYLSQLNNPAARQSTIEFINSLQAGVIPVRERGSTGAAEEVTAGNGAGLPDDWFPETRKLRERQTAQAGSITQDQHYGAGGTV